MAVALDALLSQCIGEGKNRGVSFNGDRQDEGSATVYVLLNDWRLVIVNVEKRGDGYQKAVGTERLRVYTEQKLIRVMDDSKRIHPVLAKQGYSIA